MNETITSTRPATAAHQELAERIEKHKSDTYVSVRRGMGLLALFFPFLLVAIGVYYLGFPDGIQPSLSSYYHSHDVSRNIFVGILFSVGSVLVLHKGWDWWENRLCDTAGLCAWGIALFPMEWPSNCSNTDGIFTWHGFFAFAFFSIITVVSLRDASPSGNEVPELARFGKDWWRKVAWKKAACGLGMFLCVMIGLVYYWALPVRWRQPLCNRSAVTVIESLGIISFSAYWIVKTHEIQGWSEWAKITMNAFHAGINKPTSYVRRLFMSNRSGR